jgi:hypothetical protein
MVARKMLHHPLPSHLEHINEGGLHRYHALQQLSSRDEQVCTRMREGISLED